MKDPCTTNLADFGYSERKELITLLTAWHRDGLPEDFYNEDVHAMFNRNSGHVFLTNSEYQCAMMNGNDLEQWYYCPNCGHEGFQEDCQLVHNGCNECKPDETEKEPVPDWLEDEKMYMTAHCDVPMNGKDWKQAYLDCEDSTNFDQFCPSQSLFEVEFADWNGQGNKYWKEV